MRNWPSQPPGLPPLLALALAQAHPEFKTYHGGIRYRLPKYSDRPVFNVLPIDLFANPALAEAMRSQVAGKYVLIGGDISDTDQFQTPATRLTKRTMTGLTVHASLLAQVLDGQRYVLTPGSALWLAALLVVLFAGLTSVLDVRPARLALIIAGQVVLIVGMPFYLRWMGIDTQRVPAFGWVVGWVIAYTAVGTAARSVQSDQRRFAQSALGKYLPADIASEILRDPERLSLHGEKREIYALFSDLEGFTKLSHAIPAEMVARLLNNYLDRLSAIVLRNGGTIDKFVGDAVVAFWGRADRAARRRRTRRSRRAGDLPGRRAVPPRRARRGAADRLHPRGRPPRRGDRGQFRRRGPHSIYRARRQHELRVAAGKRQQAAEIHRIAQPSGDGGTGTGYVPPAGAGVRARPLDADRNLRARPRHTARRCVAPHSAAGAVRRWRVRRNRRAGAIRRRTPG